MDIYQKIVQFLKERQVIFQIIEHQATHSSQESAAARNQELKAGAKALLIKGDENFFLAVISAACKLDSKALRVLSKNKKIRFATPQELYDLLALEKGALPPFGSPITTLPLYVDNSLLTNKHIFFNAGRLNTSITMLCSDYQAICGATFANFTQPQA